MHVGRHRHVVAGNAQTVEQEQGFAQQAGVQGAGCHQLVGGESIVGLGAEQKFHQPQALAPIADIEMGQQALSLRHVFYA